MKKWVIIVISAVVIIGIISAFFLIKSQKEDSFIYKGVWMPSFGSSSIIPEEYIPENLFPEGVDISVYHLTHQ